MSYKSSPVTNDDVITSSLAVFDANDKLLHTINYTFDVTESHWKLKQEAKVIKEANELARKGILSSEDIKKIIYELTYLYFYRYKSLVTKSSANLLSSLNYHKSILASVYRAVVDDTECDCNVHPAFLVGKSNFNCQEEQFLKIDKLKESLKSYVAENKTIDTATKKLIQFVNDTDKNYIRFDEYYSFYVSKEKYRQFLYYAIPENRDKEVLPLYWWWNPRGCGWRWWCVLGCGSDHGCCGNYDGCCLFNAILCWVHDKHCTFCWPSWYCLPRCVPDIEFKDPFDIETNLDPTDIPIWLEVI